ncbi:MAG: hypothetical protein WCR78_07415 [Arcobacteraceae bacterium]
MLADHKEEDINFSVLLNDKTSLDILNKLKNSKSARVRYLVSKHKNVKNNILHDIDYMKQFYKDIYLDKM